MTLHTVSGPRSSTAAAAAAAQSSLKASARRRPGLSGALALGLLTATPLAGTAAATAAVPTASTSTTTTTPTTPTTTTTPVLPPLHISPGGKGLRNGRDWANAGDLKDLPRFVTARPAGGEIWVRGDAGVYRTGATISLKSGGAAGAPVVVRGVDVNGAATVRPVLVGTRTAPWVPGGLVGGEVFRLQSGAKNLSFSNLAFQNQGIAFNAGGNTADIEISDMSATNMRRFFDNVRATGELTANASGITLRRVDVRGFSKSVLRLQYDSANVLLEDVQGDSEHQDGDDFAMGVHLDGTVHDVVLRRVGMRNITDTLNTYWNGDGFATERGVSRVLFEDTVAHGATDGGYDLKSSSTTLVRASASGNKRNFRLWAADTVVQGCTARDPRKRGGTGSQAQVWLGAGARAQLTDCTVYDADPATRVFELENDAHLVVQGGTVTRAATATLQTVNTGATVQFDALVQHLAL